MSTIILPHQPGGDFSPDFPDLLVRHLNHLLQSAISQEIIKDRGYRSVLRCADKFLEHHNPGEAALGALGFKQTQMLLPCILMPLYGVDGRIVLHQLRPDSPRIDQRSGRPIKYETPAKRSMRLDVAPRSLKDLGDPSVPLWITEGIKKEDALVSAGACAVGLLGVYNWRGKNDQGGLRALPEWESVSLNGRTVIICFDSDIVDKPPVRTAMERLSKFLAYKGAIVSYVRLPSGDAGAKTGVDDFLAQGHTLEDVMRLADPQPGANGRNGHDKDAPSSYDIDFRDLYSVGAGKMMYHKSIDAPPIPLGNFSARISEVIIRDDGKDQTKFFRIIGETSDGEKLEDAMVEAKDFDSLGWITTNWDTRAVIAPEQSARARVRQMLMLFSRGAARPRVYTHSGWRKIGDKWTFLTNGGAIGGDPAYVELDEDLTDYDLPAPQNTWLGDELAASLDFLEVGPAKITLPLWSAMYMSPLCSILDPSFSLFVEGLSGTYKSGITALALNHYGPRFNYNHLPASWTSTENKLERQLFLLKDMPLIIDDWAPGPDVTRARQLEAKAEQIIRNQGNRQARGRLRADTTSRKTYIPRGFLITSGEHLPGGYSASARLFVISTQTGDIKIERLYAALNQRHLYSMAMARYIEWLAPQYEQLGLELPRQERVFRNEAQRGGQHPRLPDAAACLYIGLTVGLEFMLAQRAITQQRADDLKNEGWRVLLDWSSLQAEHVQSQSPASRFLVAIQSMLAAGEVGFGNVDDERAPDRQPGKDWIGWIDTDGDYLLNPDEAYKQVQRHYAGQNDPFTINKEAVWREMKESRISDGPYRPYPNGHEGTRTRRKIAGRVLYLVKVRQGFIDDPENMQFGEQS